MAVIEGRTWLEQLHPTECWRLLGEEAIGRAGIFVNGGPEIYPVNHVVDRETIVFRTDPGSKLRGVQRGAMVCFEVDGVDAASRSGWSVMVKGHASELTAGPEIAQARTLPLQYWPHGEKSHWIRIDPVEVTGRRICRHQSSQ